MSLYSGFPTGLTAAPSDASTTTLMGQSAQFVVWENMQCVHCQAPRSFRALGWTRAGKRIGKAQCMVCATVYPLTG